ncbi:AAA family ATPase [Leptolyngbya sp. AN02str]
MQTEQVTTFTDNWTYLKTELAWLERVLMAAVSRQRKESKEIDRIAQNRADRVTSHWWRGIISLEGTPAYDEHRPSTPTTMPSVPKPSYQQQLDQRIAATQQQGVVLALPLLCDRLQLNSFEKNLVLMALAPEVNRRYANLYRFLQEEESHSKLDLPTMELVFRLLCRNDQEWRTARTRIMCESPLLQRGLVQWLVCPGDTGLNQRVKLMPQLVNFLLAESPDVAQLDGLLATPTELAQPSLLTYHTTTPCWDDLVLPQPLLLSLKTLAAHTRHSPSLQHLWNEQQPLGLGALPHSVALFAGQAGTGKTMAAGAIAHELGVPLVSVDLERVSPTDYEQLLDELTQRMPTVVLIKSAQHWLRRSATLDSFSLAQLLNQRQRPGLLTIFSVTRLEGVALAWKQLASQGLNFPLPTERDRLHLWKQAFPQTLTLANDIAWKVLAHQLALSGGDIRRIAYTAALHHAASGEGEISMQHLMLAIAQHGKTLKLPAKKATRKRKS